MVDVVLMTMPPNFNFSLRVQTQGILYLASALEKKGISVKILDLVVNNLSKEKVLNFIEKENPKIIGMTAFSNHIRDAVNFASYFKESGLNSKIVLGGSHVTLCTDFVKKFKMFDHGFVGEGEITFPIMVRNIMKGKKVKKIVKGRTVKNLDTLPFPAYHLLDMKKYMLPHTTMRFSTALISRGCPYNCSFCNVPKLCNKTVKFRSADNVLEEIELLKYKHKVGWILFTDENFTLDEKRVVELCKKIIKEKIDIKWLCETRCDLVNRKLLKIMHKAGCRTIGFGVESGSERVRRSIKGTPPSDKIVHKSFRLCDEIGIKTAAFLIFGNPGDTKEDIMKTFDIPLKLKADFIYPNPNFILPSTSLFDIALKEKIIEKDEWDKYAKGEREIPLYTPNGMEIKDILNLIIKCDASFYLRPYTIARRFKKIKNFDDFATLIRASRDITMHIFKSDFLVKRFFYTVLHKKNMNK